ncbi:right-handed parallel beta-helix repeat-containing protein [Haloferax sp. YSSS75]|uniref:right-handed parallel beta-helix repeat-containing protein n=1 Tax=Haloferax sp. YSSS75 TaxID=3388564 RepID=UPI00398C9D7C
MSPEWSPQNRGLSRRDVLRRGAVATAIAGLGLSGLSSSAVAGGEVPSDAIPIDGPTVITEPGYYVLTKDIVAKSGETLIRVEPGVNGVTIDGQGHLLEGCGKGTYPYCTGIDVGEYSESPTENFTLKNLHVTGFETGITLGDFSGGEIHDVKVTRCGRGLWYLNASDVAVTDSILAKNRTAIDATEGGNGNVFRRNRITKNDSVSFFNETSADELVFENNRVDYNGRGLSIAGGTVAPSITGNFFFQNGSVLSIEELSGGLIRGNRIIENEGDGLSIDVSTTRGSPSTTLIEENEIYRNGGVGIEFRSRVNDCTVSKNGIIGNGDDGIRIQSSDGNELVGNLIRQNDGDGIELVNSDDNVVRENVVRENAGEPIKIDENSTGNVVEDNRIGDDAPNVCYLPEE